LLLCSNHGFAWFNIQVILLEKGQNIAQSVREWGHVTLFSPWSLNISDIGRKILSEMSLPMPSAESFPTGNEFVQQYLEVLEKWLRSSGHCRIMLESEALSIGRGKYLLHYRISLSNKILLVCRKSTEKR
jgi:hypothetical protein